MATLCATVPRAKAQRIARYRAVDTEMIYYKRYEEGYDALADRLADPHPYEVPCIERFDEDGAPDEFRRWQAEAVDP